MLGVALAQWAARDDTRPQPEITRAGNTAMEAVDRMLADLHSLRGRLVSERRTSQEAAMARSGELLAEIEACRAGAR